MLKDVVPHWPKLGEGEQCFDCRLYYHIEGELLRECGMQCPLICRTAQIVKEATITS